jgi:hypothetical protein
MKFKKCDIYTQWNFIQPTRMKFYYLQENGWTCRTSPYQIYSGSEGQKLHVLPPMQIIDLKQMQ